MAGSGLGAGRADEGQLQKVTEQGGIVRESAHSGQTAFLETM
jgi:hypothetical protein